MNDRHEDLHIKKEKNVGLTIYRIFTVYHMMIENASKYFDIFLHIKSKTTIKHEISFVYDY